MPYAMTEDGVGLYYEETGSGKPLIFVHEFAGDHRSWELQMRHFGQRYRSLRSTRGAIRPPTCRKVRPPILRVAPLTTSARFSIISASTARTSLDCRWAASPRFILGSGTRPGRCRYAWLAAAMAPNPNRESAFAAEAATIADFIKSAGMPAFAEKYAYGPTRVQFENKDPRGFAEFKRMLAEHSGLGSANTQLGVQRERPSLYDLVEDMKRLTVPTLILTGDEDWPCLLPGILLKRNIPAAALAVMPNCGHAINLEAPGEFNRIVGDFLALVDNGRWPMRDPRAASASITGMKS